MSDQTDSVVFPLAKTCLYTVYALSCGSPLPAMTVKRLFNEDQFPDIEEAEKDAFIGKAKEALNSLTFYADTFCKDTVTKRYGECLKEFIGVLGTSHDVPEKYLGMMVSIFRTYMSQKGYLQNRRERSKPSYVPVSGTRDIRIASWKFIADGKDKYGKDFMLYSIIEQDGDVSHCYVVSVQEKVDDLLDSFSRVRIHVDRIERRKGVVQCVGNLVKFLES